MKIRIFKVFPLFIFSFFYFSPGTAQLGKITVDLEKDKPKKFQARTLKSEKTGEKKFTLPRRFVQNTVSHYNYFFNANNKITGVIERARLSRKDDFTTLLPFYSYSLDNTSSQSTDLDSVIYKATAGILLHDLRSDWVDNFYLLIGEAYYLRKDFDSAAMTFQFINYSLYPKNKKNQDDQLIVGSNDNGSNRAMSISSKEDRNLINKVFSRPPSRNEALIWQIRTLIEMEEYGDAAGLIATLQNDPVFPGRLDPALEEITAYWFYKQQQYDSTIAHLENSIPATIDREDQARREFLLAQLNEITRNLETASEYYDKAIQHTLDPLMDIYANLNKAKMLRSEDPAEIDRSILTLLKMAKKDKYDLYRDIIYYAAADLALIKPDTAAASALFKRSIHYNESNVSYKNKAFLNLAEISYNNKDYKNAFAFYDSLQTGDTSLGDLTQIQERRNALGKIVEQIKIIEREDSLQSIAAMSQGDRDAFIKTLSKRLRKERGVNDQDQEYTNSAAAFFDTKNSPADIFSGDAGAGNTNAKGDWYFNNASLKAKGAAEFKKVWGKRSNVDNWRRLGASQANNAAASSLAGGAMGDPLSPGGEGQALTDAAGNPITGSDSQGSSAGTEIQGDISPEGLLLNVPLTKESLGVSNNKVAKSLFQLGKNYQSLLEDYPVAIETYERSLERFPDSLYQGELYTNLSYCYGKIGDDGKANFYKNLVLNKFGGSKYAQMVTHPESMSPATKDPAATKRYTDVYNLFIEGKFDEALKEKNAADSVYGNNYWDPQLLYIEAVYFIKQRQDSVAMDRLNGIVSKFASSPLAEKAGTMIDVLKRRSSIEEYLSNLQVERVKEDSEIIVYDSAKVIKGVMPATVAARQNVGPKQVVVTTDAAVLNPEKKLAPPVQNATFIYDELQPQNVIMILDKVDPVYGSEAKNAFGRYTAEKFRLLNLEITKDTLSKDQALLVFSQFDNGVEAMKFLERIRRDAPGEVSWLSPSKYSFLVISKENLELLKQKKNLNDYLELLRKKYPGKF